jgi:glycosyltransferase involved in cell wall biosynthesis
MTVGVLSEQGGSIRNLDASGQGRRFVDQYLARYASGFDQVCYFSYADECPPLPAGCTVVPNAWGLHRWCYAFLMPLIHRRAFRQCAVLRVMQLTGEVPAIVAKLAYGIPFIATYGYDYAAHATADGASRLRAALFGVRTRIGLAFADRVIVTNQRIRAEVEKRIGVRRILFIPNAVDTQQFSPAGPPRPVAQPARIVFVGRLAPQKNLEMLIDAAARLRQPVILRLIGAGPLAHVLGARAAAANLHLELPGVVPHETLPDELRAADVFVLCSSIEGHPKALLEAMSCGCVCVGTDVEGIRDVLSHEQTGLLAEPATETLRAALERALGDAAVRLRLAANARAHVLAHYDISVTLGAEIRAMQELAGERN